MKKIRLLLISVFSVLLYTQAEAQTTNAFRVNYDQALFDLPGNAVEALTNSNYVFAGTNLNFLPIYGTVTQIDDIGNLVWSKRYYDGSIGFQLNDIKKDAANSEYYLCGGSESNAGVFMRIDATGNVLASTKFSISQADGAYFNRVIKASDGGYVAVGYVIGYDPDGGGAEIYYASQNCTDSNGDSHTEYFGSPLIVKMDNNGNHLWHKVFRYYNNAAKNATDRIYNDASFVDVVEVSDGYIAVGSYDVNDWNPDPSNDCNDQSPTDAILLKTTTAGTITYHKQFDAISFSSSQSSKYFGAINKTSAGAPIAVGYDNSKEWITKYPSSGGWGLTFSRDFTYSSSFFGTDPVDNSQIYEVAGGTDLVTMGMYIKPLSFVFSNSLHRVNSTATSNVWAKYYTFSLATLLPRGSQTSDGGYIMTSMTTGAANYDYHVIKTDPSGDTPLSGCAPTSFTPSASAGPTTVADPYYNVWTGTVGPQTLALTVASVTPATSVQCSYTVCTAPTITTQPTDNTMCSTDSDVLSVVASGGPYQWQYNNGGTWENVTNSSPAGFTYANGTTDVLTINTSGAAQGTYQFQVIAGTTGCETTSNTVTVTVPGANQITATTPACSGTAFDFEALPSTGATYNWTVTAPGGTSASPTSGSGQTFTYTPTNTTGSNQNFNVSVGITYNGTTCTENFTNTIISLPSTPTTSNIVQPDCINTTGSVDLGNLPSSGTWTITANPGGATQTGTGTTATFTGLTAGTTYTFTVTNSGGCVSGSTGNVVINTIPAAPGAPVIGTITQPTCSVATGSVDLSGLPASGTWTITTSPGGATQTGTGTTATISGLTDNTTYTFTVTNAAGCTSGSSANAVVNAQPATPTAPVIGTITQPTCSVATGSVDLSGLPASGSWTITATPGSATQTGTGTTATFTGLTAGTTYTFTVTNAAGCTSTSSTNAVINTVPSAPSAPLTSNIVQPDCSTATGSVDLSGLPASGTWTITTTPGGATQTGTGTTTTISGLTANTTYTFTVEDASGCVSGSSSNVIIDPQPATPSAPIIGTITQPDCINTTGSIDLSGLPASGSWTITTTPGGATQTGTGTTATVSGLSSGSYTFTVTNAAGCTSSTSSSATVDPIPSGPTAPTGTVTQPTCSTPTGTIDVTDPIGSNYTYSIDGINYQTSASFTGLTTGSYTITVQDVNTGCTTSSVTSYTVDPVAGAPVITLDSLFNVTCNGDSDGAIYLTITGGQAPYTYSWTPNAGSTDDVTGLTPGSYTVLVTDNLGCSSTDNWTITEPQSIAGNGAATDVDCSNSTLGSVTLNATGGSGNYTYSWTPNGETTSGISGLTAGSYSVTITDDNGCTSTENYTVSNSGNLGVDATPDNATITSGSSVDITTTGADTYVWTPSTGLSCSDCANPIATPDQTTLYIVTGTDALGCTGSDSVLIVVEKDCAELFVPTIFSPNGTGPSANEYLCVYGECITEIQFRVFDRWGEMVFETASTYSSTSGQQNEICWDGTYKGKPVQEGTFVYTLYVMKSNGDVIETSGNITLVR